MMLAFSFANASNSNIALSMLNSVNAEWAKQPESKLLATTVSIEQNHSFNDWIQTHLMLVEKALRERSTNNLNSTQKQNRLALLDKLNNYWHTKVFPVNDYLAYKNPVFIDRKGTHCAVGFLMQQSGYESLAKQIDAEQKFAYVHEIKVKGVEEWANEYGFTIDELAWIQPGYPVNTSTSDLLGGVNGDVNAIVIDNTGMQYYVAGSFSQTTSGVQASNIACYLSGFAGYFWTDVNGGVNGTINCMIKHNNKLYVGGEFTLANGIAANHVVAYDLQSGQWESVGSLDSTVNCLTVYNNEIYAGGSFTSFVKKWNGTSWIDFSSSYLYGSEVRTLKVHNNELYIGGDFELPTGALRRHVVKYDGTQMLMSGFGTPTPVNDFEVLNNKIYAACDFIKGSDTCALAVLDGSDWQTIVKPNVFVGDALFGKSFNDLQAVGSKLYCGGSFQTMSLMSYGNNLMSFEHTGTALTDYQMTPLLNTDSTISCLATIGTELYFGGKFETNNYSDTLNHVGFITIGITDLKKVSTGNNKVFISPNPSSTNITFSTTLKKIQSVVISDTFGKIVISISGTPKNNSLDISGLKNGVYNLKIIGDSIVENTNFIKVE